MTLLAITLIYLICFAFYVTHDIAMDTVIDIAFISYVLHSM